jgi:hypothetical protein
MGTAVKHEIRGPLVHAGLQAGQWACFLAPILGLPVFWLVPFKPAATLYVLIVGLTMVVQKVVELRRRSFEIEEIARRHLHGNHTH